jgi:hypothetical protein
MSPKWAMVVLGVLILFIPEKFRLYFIPFDS